MASRWTLAGNVYVTGANHFGRFSVGAPAAGHQHALRGSADAFVSKLSFDAGAARSSLAYSTYLGGSGGDVGNAIAVDPLATPT